MANGLEGLQTCHFFRTSVSPHRAAESYVGLAHPHSTAPFTPVSGFQSSCLEGGRAFIAGSTLLVPVENKAQQTSGAGQVFQSPQSSPS